MTADYYMRRMVIDVHLPGGLVASRTVEYFPPAARGRLAKITITDEQGCVLRSLRFELPSVDDQPIARLVCPLDGPLIGVTP